MNSLLIITVGVWGIGIVIYVVASKSDRYNNVRYVDVSKKIRKYKMSDEKININRRK